VRHLFPLGNAKSDEQEWGAVLLNTSFPFNPSLPHHFKRGFVCREHLEQSTEPVKKIIRVGVERKTIKIDRIFKFQS